MRKSAVKFTEARNWASVFFAAVFSLLVLLLLHYRSELAPFLLLPVFAPLSAERRQQQSPPLKAMQDCVLALDGKYEIVFYEQNLTHRISFQQNKLQNNRCQYKNALLTKRTFPDIFINDDGRYCYLTICDLN